MIFFFFFSKYSLLVIYTLSCEKMSFVLFYFYVLLCGWSVLSLTMIGEVQLMIYGRGLVWLGEF